jgi:hypothetical protein
MIPKSGYRFSEKIMLKQRSRVGWRFEEKIIPLWPLPTPTLQGGLGLPCGRKPVISLCSPGDDLLLRTGLSLCPIIVDAKLSREGEMVDGTMVPVIAIGVLAAIWAVVLFGSSFFGPR